MQRAVATARRAFEQDPGVREYEQVLAMALYFAGEYGDCADHLTSLSARGETAYLGRMLAIALHELGQKEAAPLGRRMLRQMSANPSKLTRSVVSRGQELFRLGPTQE